MSHQLVQCPPACLPLQPSLTSGWPGSWTGRAASCGPRHYRLSRCRPRRRYWTAAARYSGPSGWRRRGCRARAAGRLCGTAHGRPHRQRPYELYGPYHWRQGLVPRGREQTHQALRLRALAHRAGPPHQARERAPLRGVAANQFGAVSASWWSKPQFAVPSAGRVRRVPRRALPLKQKRVLHYDVVVLTLVFACVWRGLVPIALQSSRRRCSEASRSTFVLPLSLQ